MNKKIAYGYIRVSTAMQKEDGISLDTQTKKIQDYCNYKELQLNKIYQDAGISGGTMERPALKEVLDTIQKGDYLVVAELSRLSRKTNDALNILETIKNKKAYLISLNPDIDFSTTTGELMFTILSAFHQLERRQISERVSSNMKNLSNQNLLRTKSPYGYKFISKEQDMVKDEEQQKVIEIIKQMHENGSSYSFISKYLNFNNFHITLNADGSQIFYPQTIKNILADYGIVKMKKKTLDDRCITSRIK